MITDQPLSYSNALQVLDFQPELIMKKVKWTTDKFEIMEDFIWYLDFQYKEVFVIIPKWFVTNFWSIPRGMRPFLTPTKYLAYILHDRLYSVHWRIIYHDEYESHVLEYTRREADLVLKNALIVEWSFVIEANIIYLWVRLWGNLHYKIS